MTQLVLKKPERIDWGHQERAAFMPPPTQTISEWAEDHRHLDPQQSVHSGRWRNAVAPYLVWIMNLCAYPGITELTVKKAAQVGVSEAIRCVIGYKAHTDPDPMLLVLPNEKKGRGIVRKRIHPLFKTTAALKDLIGDRAADLQLEEILLKNGFEMSLGWSGSATSLASDPKRIVINDEVDKFSPYSGKESDAVSLGRERTATYEDRRLVVNISTPTTEDGLITVSFNEADIQLHTWWKCPGCSEHFIPTLQALKYEYPKDIAKNDKAAKARAVKLNQSAWMECPDCQFKIRERHKAKIVRESFYAPLINKKSIKPGSWRLFCDGTETGAKPDGEHVAIHLGCFPCSWRKFYDIAPEYIRAQGSLSKMQHLYNSKLGLEFKLQVASPTIKLIETKIQKFIPPGILPPWTGKLIAAADIQKDHAWYETRAYGYDFRSLRIDHGKVGPFKDGRDFLEELYNRTIGTVFQFDGQKWAGLRPTVLAIDTGGTGLDEGDEDASMTQRAYKFALRDPRRVIACKSESDEIRNPLHYRVSNLEQGKKRKTIAAQLGVKLYLIGSNWFKDILMSQIKGLIEIIDMETGEVKKLPKWSLNSLRDEVYEMQMVSEHKILNTKGKKIWVPIQTGNANHYWDVNMLLTFAAHLVGVDNLPTSEEIEAIRNKSIERVAPQEKLTTPDGRPYHVGDR